MKTNHGVNFMNQNVRHGLLAGGNFITDNVKIIDAWPQQDELASIRSQSMSSGGGPYNVLKDLAALKVGFPLEAVGLVGDDANGQWVRRDCEVHGIDITQLRTTRDAATSYTDAMCVESDGRRTFFHQRGANSFLAADHIDLAASRAKIFLLGYLLLLDALDSIDDDGRTEASRVLERARKLGFMTAVETVSSPDPGFRMVVTAAMEHADIFFTNEVEASLILGEQVSAKVTCLIAAAKKIAALGCPGRVVVHSTQGAVCRELDGTLACESALKLPKKFIQGSTGAGDAFTAGFLSGAHDGCTTAESLLRGVCVAAASLSDPTASLGVVPLAECLSLAKQFGFQKSQKKQ